MGYCLRTAWIAPLSNLQITPTSSANAPDLGTLDLALVSRPQALSPFFFIKQSSIDNYSNTVDCLFESYVHPQKFLYDNLVWLFMSTIILKLKVSEN